MDVIRLYFVKTYRILGTSESNSEARPVRESNLVLSKLPHCDAPLLRDKCECVTWEKCMWLVLPEGNFSKVRMIYQVVYQRKAQLNRLFAQAEGAILVSSFIQMHCRNRSITPDSRTWCFAHTHSKRERERVRVRERERDRERETTILHLNLSTYLLYGAKYCILEWTFTS